MTRLEAVTAAGGQRSFGDRVAEAVTARSSQLVLGLDPDLARLWPRAAEIAQSAGEGSGSPAACAARAVAAHCALVLEATAEQCVAVKPQVACFERLGAPGWAALGEVVQLSRDHGLLVIADAKRGDIDVTAAAYAQAFFGVTPTPFGSLSSLGVDALTVNPLLGADSVAPLLARAREWGCGLFVLVRTSNPGAADVQDLELAQGGTISERLAELVLRLGGEGIGAAGLSDVGAVVGATAADQIEALRERMPQAIFLLPGVGPQGGTVERLGPAFRAGPAGGLVTVSRGLVEAHQQLGREPSTAAGEQAKRLRDQIWDLAR